MEAQESDQIVMRRVLAVTQLLVTALHPEEWAVLAAVPFQDTPPLPVNLEGNLTDAGQVPQ